MPRLLTTVALLLLLLLTSTYTTTAVSSGVAISNNDKNGEEKFSLPGFGGGRQALLNLVCHHTLFPDACLNELSSFQISITATFRPSQLVTLAIRAALARATESHSLALQIASRAGLRLLDSQCANDCVDLMDNTLDALGDVVSSLSSLSLRNPGPTLRNVKALLSSCLSFQAACSDGFVVSPGSVQIQIQVNQDYLAQVVGNALDLVDILAVIGDNLAAWMSGQFPTIRPPFIHLRRRSLLSLPGNDHILKAHGFPHWVSAAERRLLQSPSSSVQANAVVAKDGSGNFLNITSALKNIPKGYKGRYVLYIKSGVYNEVFNISKNLDNLTFLGDGIGKTIITGNRNVASGKFNTYRTSTVGIAGSGFYARDITFQNTAGPSGHQAVAVRAGADYMVFYRCSFEGYQDTLYALSSRQFYRECTISGTVDFIFGNAIAVFQSCVLVARVPMGGQQNTYTAQGRKLAADVSGFSFQNCTITGEAELLNGTSSAPTYLGRPWKEYSRVVIIQSQMDALVHPAGWLAWNASNPFTDTLYYGEFQNRGPGAATAQRVGWAGVHPNMSADDASQFTVQNFIAGDTWLNAVEVQYQSNLV